MGTAKGYLTGRMHFVWMINEKKGVPELALKKFLVWGYFYVPLLMDFGRNDLVQDPVNTLKFPEFGELW